MTVIRKITRPKLTKLVADRLGATIRAGNLAPGDKLPTERELGERFGVSRNVVREAVNELRARGLLVTRHGSGSVVSGEVHKPVRNAMKDLLAGHAGAEGKLLEFRRILEVHIAELAAQRATVSEIKDMDKILTDFDAAKPDLKRCAELDIAFHQALCRAARNELFGVVVEPLNELLTVTRRRALDRSGAEVAAQSHRDLLEAVRQRDPKRAAACMGEHIDMTMKSLTNIKKGARR